MSDHSIEFDCMEWVDRVADHKANCLFSCGGKPQDCTCGLRDLRKKIEHSRGRHILECASNAHSPEPCDCGLESDADKSIYPILVGLDDYANECWRRPELTATDAFRMVHDRIKELATVSVKAAPGC